MPLTLDWSEVGVRLFFSILAGALIGWNRGETGHPAGLRTTLLVCVQLAWRMGPRAERNASRSPIL
jgi:uncharacterized membrane protein YhiD involved in acid resistance